MGFVEMAVLASACVGCTGVATPCNMGNEVEGALFVRARCTGAAASGDENPSDHDQGLTV